MEWADEEAKKAAAGRSSPRRKLPTQLHNPLPRSRTSIVRTYRTYLDTQHDEAWRSSPRYAKFSLIDNSEATKASRAYWKLSRNLPRKLLSILTQIRTGHVPLNAHLHRIQRADSPECPCCKRHPETVFHYLIECPSHRAPRSRLRRKIGYSKFNIATLLTDRATLKHLFRYINDTKCFHHIVGDLPELKTDDDDEWQTCFTFPRPLCSLFLSFFLPLSLTPS